MWFWFGFFADECLKLLICSLIVVLCLHWLLRIHWGNSYLHRIWNYSYTFSEATLRGCPFPVSFTPPTSLAMAGLNFFSLPAEIRDVIYSLVFTQEDSINVYWGALAQAENALQNCPRNYRAGDWLDHTLQTTDGIERMHSDTSRRFIRLLRENSTTNSTTATWSTRSSVHSLDKIYSTRYREPQFKEAGRQCFDTTEFQLQAFRVSKLFYEEASKIFYTTNLFNFHIGEKKLRDRYSDKYRFWISTNLLKFPTMDFPTKYLPMIRRCTIQVQVSSMSNLSTTFL